MLSNIYQIPKTAKFKAVQGVRHLPPKRVPNKSVRSREYLTTHEIEDLRKAARTTGRQGHWDDTLVLILFRHAFRVSEVISLRWEQIDLKLGLLHVQRIKNGISSTHRGLATIL
jgi:type 1 fimbriae regulatory protein FimE